MTAEATRLADQLKRAFDGSAWHGPSLFEALKGVDSRMANARPIAGAHTIWELTLHVAAWEGAILRRLKGEALQLKGAENFPKILKAGEKEWQKAKKLVRDRHAELLFEVARLSEPRLRGRVPGKKYDFGFMLDGAVQHIVYHAGQIQLLRKALE